MTELEASVAAPEISHAGAGAWFVRGPAGSGKSWLLDRIAAAATERRPRWVRAGSVALDDSAALQGATLLVDDVDTLSDDTLEALASLAAEASRRDVVMVCAERIGRTRQATARVATACTPVSLTGLDPLRPTFRDLVGDASPEDVETVLADTSGWYELVSLHPGIAGSESVVDVARPRLAALSKTANRLAVVLAFGASLADGSAERFIDVEGDEFDALVGELDATGILHASQLTDLMAEAIRAATPAGRRRDVLAEVLAADLRPAVGRLADWLITTDDRSPEALDVLVAASRSRPPSAAAEVLEVAVAAGAGEHAVELLAIAHLRSGRAVDAVPRAASVGGGDDLLRAALARSGRMIDASRTSGGDAAVQSALVAAGVGDTGRASSALGVAPSVPIGEEATAIALLRGSLALLAGDANAPSLLRDARRLSLDGVDTSTWVIDPATAAVIISTEAADGDDRIDENVIPAFADLSGVVGAWQSMRAGRLGEARAAWPDGLTGLEAALASVVDAALALRADQLDALPSLVSSATVALEGVQLDAWRFAAFVDLIPAAARVGVDVDRLVGGAEGLLGACGAGSLLELANARAQLTAAITADDAEAAVSVARSLAELEGESPAHQLWRSVAPVIASVFADEVDADAVLEAATAMRDAGLVFEAGRLTGAAALRCGDERTTKALLRESRAIRQERKAAGGGHRGDVTELSDREVEVGRLVLQGRTHKEVGATLFISAKTVEHHVARIRNKLGASGRAEMMAAIRDYLDAIDDIDALEG